MVPAMTRKSRFARQCESQARGGHENRADDQHAPAADTIRSCCEVKRNDDITGEGQRENQGRPELP